MATGSFAMASVSGRLTSSPLSAPYPAWTAVSGWETSAQPEQRSTTASRVASGRSME
ncbi:hypothetical protein [Nocardioides sp. NPDC006303]|uniref:hypothetical protein n=1 Tax=Nocardioides sp. NPDC006303 TaxID=3156747 RepID=UPI0033ABF661